MDPLTAVSLAGTLIQFIDFGTRIVAKTAEVYRSADGSPRDTSDVHFVAAKLKDFSSELAARANLENDTKLHVLCLSCLRTSEELLEVTAKVVEKSGESKWKSFKKALRSVWSHEQVQELRTRLNEFRLQLDLAITSDIREKQEFHALCNSDRFDLLDQSQQFLAKQILLKQDAFEAVVRANFDIFRAERLIIVTTIADEGSHMRDKLDHRVQELKTQQNVNRDVIVAAVQTHASNIISEHQQDNQKAMNRIGQIEDTLTTNASRDTNAILAEQHELRLEVTKIQQMIAQNTADTAQRIAELTECINAINGMSTDKRQQTLRERGNALTAALLALDIVYEGLLDVLHRLQAQARQICSSEVVRSMFYSTPLHEPLRTDDDLLVRYEKCLCLKDRFVVLHTWYRKHMSKVILRTELVNLEYICRKLEGIGMNQDLNLLLHFISEQSQRSDPELATSLRSMWLLILVLAAVSPLAHDDTLLDESIPQMSCTLLNLLQAVFMRIQIVSRVQMPNGLETFLSKCIDLSKSIRQAHCERPLVCQPSNSLSRSYVRDEWYKLGLLMCWLFSAATTSPKDMVVSETYNLAEPCSWIEKTKFDRILLPSLGVPHFQSRDQVIHKAVILMHSMGLLITGLLDGEIKTGKLERGGSRVLPARNLRLNVTTRTQFKPPSIEAAMDEELGIGRTAKLLYISANISQQPEEYGLTHLELSLESR